MTASRLSRVIVLAPMPRRPGKGHPMLSRSQIGGISSTTLAKPCKAWWIGIVERLRAERHDQRRRRYEEMVRLHRLGLPGHAIGRAVGASALTVYRWLKAGGPPSHNKPEQPRNIAPYEAFLARRWAEGCRNGARLWRELRAQGYRGGERVSYAGPRSGDARKIRGPRTPNDKPQYGPCPRPGSAPASSARRLTSSRHRSGPSLAILPRSHPR